MAKLNQIIAIEKGIKSRVHSDLTELHKASQKPDLFNGFSKHYQKKDDAGEDLPPESKRVQMAAQDCLRQASRLLSELMDVTARKDWTNCVAKAPVKIDGIDLLPPTPVSFLLFLEKQLTDFRTFVDKLPLQDESEDWTLDPHSGLYKAAAATTHRTKKIQKPIVLYNATPEHPAQTQLITEDVIVGFWNSVKQTGAIPKTEKRAIVERVDTLLKAIKQAREQANGQDEVETPDAGNLIFTYLLKRPDF